MDDEGILQEELSVEQYGLPRAEPGKWASCIRIVDPRTMQTTDLIDLDENEAAFRYAAVLPRLWVSRY